jgi:uncharacterized protein YndB with AHSA1/START domain
MTMQAGTGPSTAVTRSITVEAPIERAFDVFTNGIGTWWNPDHHLMEVEEMVFDPFVGGNIIDRGHDGTEHRWSRVLAYEPPDRVIFSWDISLEWQLETDLSKTSEVEVTFSADGPERTHVTLEHRHLDRHGEGFESMRTAVDSGWDLTDFARAAEDAAESR